MCEQENSPRSVIYVGLGKALQLLWRLALGAATVEADFSTELADGIAIIEANHLTEGLDLLRPLHAGASDTVRVCVSICPWRSSLLLPRLPRHESEHEKERSDERRVRQECVSKCRSRWAPYL